MNCTEKKEKAWSAFAHAHEQYTMLRKARDAAHAHLCKMETTCQDMACCEKADAEYKRLQAACSEAHRAYVAAYQELSQL